MRLLRWLAVLFCFGLVPVVTLAASWSGTIPVGGAPGVTTAVTASLSATFTEALSGGVKTVTLTGQGTCDFPGYAFVAWEKRNTSNNSMVTSGAVVNPPATPGPVTQSITLNSGQYLFVYFSANSGSNNGNKWFSPSQSPASPAPGFVVYHSLLPQNITATKQAPPGGSMIMVSEKWTIGGNMTQNVPAITGVSGCNVLLHNDRVTLMVTPTAANYQFSVTVDGDNYYFPGATHAESTAAPFSKNWKFNISNSTDNPIAWRVIQGSQVLDSGTAPAKSTGTVSGTTADGETPILLQYRTDWTWNDELGRWERLNPPVWVTSPSQNIVNDPQNTEDNTNLDGADQPNTVDKTQVTPFQTVTDQNESNAVTSAQFAEGIGKVEAAINTQGKAIKGATTEVMQAVQGAKTSVDQAKAAIEAGTEATQALGPKLDEINSKLQSANEQRAQQIEAELEARTLWERITTPIEETWAKQQEIEALRAAAAAEMPSREAAAIQSAKEVIPDIAPSNYLHGDPTAPNLSVTLPTLFGGKTVDLNPFQFSGFATIVSWFRSATLWLVVLHFAYWVSGEVKTFAIGFSAANQAQGNQVMGSGGQATAAVNAGVVTVAFSTLVASLLAFLYGDFQLSSMVSIIGASPLAGMPAAALWFLDKFFPIAIMLTGLALRVTWRWWGIQAYAVAAAVIRWCIT